MKMGIESSKILIAINYAIGKNMNKMLIIFNDNVLPMNVLTKINNEIDFNEITCVAFGSYNNSDPKNPNEINSLILHKSIYNEFMEDLQLFETSWRIIILKYIQRHYFTSKIIQYDHNGTIYE